jgi:hypothetical protein
LPKNQIVMPALIAGMHVVPDVAGKTWMAGEPGHAAFAFLKIQCACKTWTYKER